MHKFFLVFIFLFTTKSIAQEVVISGTVKEESGASIHDVNVRIENTGSGVATDANGKFTIVWPANTEDIILLFTHIGYEDQRVPLNINAQPFSLEIVLRSDQTVLKGVEIKSEEQQLKAPSIQKIDPKKLDQLPAPFNDFNSILLSLPGVVSNNELSSAYSVRGGSYDENMVFVNGIPVYRPFLVTNGQQEGLSFVNPQMTSSVSFSTGGWGADYGDKMSSVLNITYKKPEAFAGSAQLGLLGGFIQLEGSSKNNRLSWVTGLRHKRASYLLNTLETKGSYKPKFTDWQNFLNFGIGKQQEDGTYKTNLGVLLSYATNRYNVVPESRETEFGTFNQALKLFVAFEGQEQLHYDTYQGGINLSHSFNKKIKTNLIVSSAKTRERQIRDIEAAYLLCELDKDINSNTFNTCLVERGAGINYENARNFLNANLHTGEVRNEIKLDNEAVFKFGAGITDYHIEEQLNEYSYVDSADYTTNIYSIQADNSIQHQSYSGYASYEQQISPALWLSFGARLLHWNWSNETAINPRIQLAYKPWKWEKDITFKLASGLYHQAPFYRDLRNQIGEINNDIKMQSSVHVIAGMDYNFEIWGRKFKLFSEAYYKKVNNLIPYDVDNVRLLYYGENAGNGFTYGIDARISGEFIKGAESWFSLSYLQSKEDVTFDERGYIRRPMDQRVNLGIHFEDHMPNAPTWRVNLNTLIGTGLPFGPPSDVQNRNALNGEIYRRVDIGFVKVLDFEKENGLKQLLLGVEVLNLLGAANVISYTWVEDVNNNQFAVPNDLSARFLNVKITAYF